MDNKVWKDYINWLEENGMNMQAQKVKVKEFVGSGMGLVSKEDIKYGQTYLNVPGSVIISLENIVERHNLYEIINLPIIESLNLSSSLWICFYLLVQMSLKENSFYFHYFNVLPSEFPILQFIYKLEFIDSFGFEILEDKFKDTCEKRIQSIVKEFNTIYELVKIYPIILTLFDHKIEHQIKDNILYFNELKVDYDLFLYVWLIVNTRCVYFNDPNKNKKIIKYQPIALVPFMDWLNHSFDCKFSSQFKRNQKNQIGYCKFNSLQNIKKEEQVFIQYGAHGDLFLLFEYGFIVGKHNPFNYLSLDYFVWQYMLDVYKLNINYNDLKNDIEKVIKECTNNNIKQFLIIVKEKNILNEFVILNDGTIDYKLYNLIRLFHLPCFKDQNQDLELWLNYWNQVWLGEREDFNEIKDNNVEVDILDSLNKILTLADKFYNVKLVDIVHKLPSIINSVELDYINYIQDIYKQNINLIQLAINLLKIE